jgi:HEAT repeat protein
MITEKGGCARMGQNSSMNQRIEALEKALKDPDEGVRQKAAESLSRIEAMADLDTYTRMLDSDDRSVRIQAIYLLAELATETAIELLRLQVNDAYDDVRAAVIQALGNSANNYRTRETREKAVDIALIGLEDVNLSIRASAANTLGRFYHPRSVEALLSIVTSGSDDESEDIKLVVSALLALGEIEDRKVVPQIIEKAEVDNLEIKEAALKALGMIGDPKAEDCLIQSLASENAKIRMQAAESLGKI